MSSELCYSLAPVLCVIRTKDFHIRADSNSPCALDSYHLYIYMCIIDIYIHNTNNLSCFANPLARPTSLLSNYFYQEQFQIQLTLIVCSYCQHVSVNTKFTGFGWMKG